MLPWRGPTIIKIPFEKGSLDAGHHALIRAARHDVAPLPLRAQLRIATACFTILYGGPFEVQLCKLYK